MDRNEVEVDKHAKKERGQYPAILTEQAWSIKDFSIWDKTENHDKFYAPSDGPLIYNNISSNFTCQYGVQKSWLNFSCTFCIKSSF